jgi:hypothetical protein
MKIREEGRAEPPNLVRVYGGLYRAIRNALYRHNPVGTERVNKAAQYQPIIGLILARWREIDSVQKLNRIIDEELLRWHGTERVGVKSAYDQVAENIWLECHDIFEAAHSDAIDATSEQYAVRRREAYATLYYTILNILHKYDPIGIAYLADEYTPEVETILPRLKETSSVEGVNEVIYQEFVRWFDSELAGSKARYDKIAEEVWAAWQKHKLDNQ